MKKINSPVSILEFGSTRTRLVIYDEIARNQNLFYDNDIRLVYQNFSSNVYHQNTDVFVPDLSIIDLLANLGPNSKSFLFK